MATKYYHSIEEPPPPKSWRIVRSADNFDIEVEIYCPNGHKMVVPADMGYHLARIPLNIAHGCIICDFKDVVYLVSDPSLPKMVQTTPNIFLDFFREINDYYKNARWRR